MPDPASKTRCRWATDELSAAYHDEEWGVPVHDDRRLFEFLILEGAQGRFELDYDS
jgi:DNA-3-methyladenine glycosylase I